MTNAIIVIGVLAFLVLACGPAAVLVALVLSKPNDDYNHQL